MAACLKSFACRAYALPDSSEALRLSGLGHIQRRDFNVCCIAKAVQTNVHIPPHKSHPTPKSDKIPVAAVAPSISDCVAPAPVSTLAAEANQKIDGMTVPSSEKTASSTNP